jgi:hypothetical protein
MPTKNGTMAKDKGLQASSKTAQREMTTGEEEADPLKGIFTMRGKKNPTWKMWKNRKKKYTDLWATGNSAEPANEG